MATFQPHNSSRAPENSVIVHASKSWFSAVRNGQFDFFEKLGKRALEEGFTPLLVREETPKSAKLLAKPHVHILCGNRLPTQHKALFAMPTYVWGFWYLDPKGIHWNSSLVDEAFVPDAIDLKTARYFFNGVSGYMLRENVSKFSQNARAPDGAKAAKAVIFLQEIDKYKRPVHYLKTEEIIQTVASSTDGIVYVKPHPAHTPEHKAKYLEICKQHPNIVVSNQSVHDLSAMSNVVISQNSAAGFEAIMQKKPIITCGQTDYHHATVVAKSKTDLEHALESAPDSQKGFPFEKYFYWFLGLHMLEAQKPEFEDRVWSRIRAYMP